MERYEGFEEWLPRARPTGPGADSGLTSTISAQWLSALYQSPVLFSGLLDRHGRLLEANRISVEGSGLHRSTTIGQFFWEGGWWSPDPALTDRVRRWCEEAVRSGRSLSAVTRYFRADGNVGMVELGLVPIIDFDAPGEPVSHIVITGLDISPLLVEQAAREDRLAAAQATSLEAEKRFRDALNAMIDHVTIARTVRADDGSIVDFEIDFISRASLDGAGRAPSELVGRRVCELYPYWRQSGMFDRFAAVVETGLPFIGDRIPYHDVLDDGTSIHGWWDLQVSKLDDGYIAATRDVTAVVKAEAANRVAEAAAAREQLAMEILQDAALSVDLPPLTGVSIGLHYQPAAGEVPIGGDWYDVIALPDGHLTLIIADVAGHGPEIASFMVQLRNVLRAVATDVIDPAELLSRTNRVVALMHGLDAPFTTSCVAVVDPDRRTLRWSLAGHPPALLRSPDGMSRFLEAEPGLPLGVRTHADYTTSETALQSGDRLVLYTDGLIESRQTTLDAGMDRLRQALDEVVDVEAEEAAKWLAAAVSAGADDVAVIVLDVGH